MFDSKYYRNKFVHRDKNGNLALLVPHYDIAEAHSMTLSEEGPNRISYRAIPMNSPEFAGKSFKPLRVFLIEYNYSDSDFRNPFTRELKIVTEIHNIDVAQKGSKDKQKTYGEKK